jgi:serine/threonine protein kinase
MIGTQIGSYQIIEKIGEGGMGVVYRGVDVTLDRAVAIKVLSPELVGNASLLERFRAEAKAQANLNHTNIATLYAFIQSGETCVIVMELLEGETFDQMIRRRGVIPAEEAVPLFRQALLGIGFAHRMGIVHRDIKPSNIMLTKSGIVKVMDFGIAKVLGGQRMTRTGTRMGTVAYMSPEQIRNMPVDIRSDIYSLGATLYEMFTAHLPFESESDFQVMSDHVNTPPTPPTRYYPYIAPGFEQCVMKALSKDPNQRFQTVEEFGAGLEHPLGLPGYVPPAPYQQQWNQQAPPAQPGGWTPPPSAAPAQPGGWTPTGAAPGGQWAQPGTPQPSGGWTPPPGTPPGGTYPGAAASGQHPMSGATWIGDGPPGSVPVYSPPMSGATQATIPPGRPPGPPTTGAQAGPSKNVIFAIIGAAALVLIILAIGVAHWRSSEESGGGGTPSSTYVAGGSGGAGAVNNGTESVNGGSGGGSTAPSAPPSQPILGGGSAGGSAGGTGGAGGLVPQPSTPAPSLTPTAPGNGGGNRPAAAPPTHKVTPAPAPSTPSSPQPSQPAPPQPTKAPEPAPSPAPAPAPSAPAPAGSHKYFVQHRHVSIDFTSKTVATQSYCEGYLTVNPDGTGSYFCTQTFDGRCDRVTFGPGSIKEVKVKGTQLHLSTTYGNYDFYGTAAEMQAAYTTLSATVKH